MTDLTDDKVRELLGFLDLTDGRQKTFPNSYVEDLARALLAARAERDRAVEVVRQMHHAVCGETGFAAAVRANTGLAYPWPELDLAEEIALEVMRKDMVNV